MAFRPFLSSSGISPVVRGRWAGPLLLVYILWYNIYSLLCPDGRSRAAPPLSCCCGHCRCRRCPRRHLYCGGCRANPNIPPFLFFFHLLRPTKFSPLRLLLWCLTGGERKVGQSPSPIGGQAAAPLLLWPLLVLPASSSVTFFIMVVAGFLAPSSSFFSTWPNLLHFICFPSPVVRLLHFLLLPPSSLLPPLASKFLTESA